MMTTTVEVPAALRRSVIGFNGTRGALWADALPDMVAEYTDRWELRLDLPSSGVPWHGAIGIVVPVRTRDDVPAVLKISPADPENEHEHTALSAWNGDGSVHLLDADPSHRVMLLERLDGDHDLTTLPVEDAIIVLADLVKRLAVPAPPEIEAVTDQARRWADELPSRWHELGCTEPAALLDRAVDAARELGPTAGRLLIHTDLHYENVLAAPGAVALERGRWLAIDPKPLAGDREFAVVPMLWNRLDELDGADRPGALRQRMRDITAAAGLDLDRVREWSIAREVANIVSYAENGMATDRERSAWVASTLAE